MPGTPVGLCAPAGCRPAQCGRVGVPVGDGARGGEVGQAGADLRARRPGTVTGTIGRGGWAAGAAAAASAGATTASAKVGAASGGYAA